MSDCTSVSGWIEQLKQGDEAAAQKVWERYYERLIALARKKLAGNHKRVADEEDVVLNTLDTLFRNTRDGHFPELKNRDDLWPLLVKITERKASNQLRDQNRLKRGGGKVKGHSAVEMHNSTGQAGGFDNIAGSEPTPEFVATLTETMSRLFEKLDSSLQQIAQLKMAGNTNKAIAQTIGRAEVTVERRLKLIRDKWQA